MGFPGSLVVKNLPAMEETRVPAMQETWVRSSQDPLEEGMATHSSILAWETPWREEPGGLYTHGVMQNQTLLKCSLQQQQILEGIIVFGLCI